MSIKKIVNDPLLWESFVQEMDEWLEREYRFLENAREVVDIHKAQGSVRILRKLKNLREIVNERK